MIEAGALLEPLRRLHAEIRDAVVRACEEAALEDLSKVDHEAEADTIYAVDRVSEDRLVSFFEKEIARTTERFGNVVHAFSTYESRRAASDPTPFMRGINSIQLFTDGKRWYVVTIFWESESPANPIPAKYLP